MGASGQEKVLKNVTYGHDPDLRRGLRTCCCSTAQFLQTPASSRETVAAAATAVTLAAAEVVVDRSQHRPPPPSTRRRQLMDTWTTAASSAVMPPRPPQHPAGEPNASACCTFMMAGFFFFTLSIGCDGCDGTAKSLRREYVTQIARRTADARVVYRCRLNGLSARERQRSRFKCIRPFSADNGGAQQLITVDGYYVYANGRRAPTDFQLLYFIRTRLAATPTPHRHSRRRRRRRRRRSPLKDA